MARAVVCGAGNADHGDEGIGRAVVEQLKVDIRDADVLVIDCGSDPRRHLRKILDFRPSKAVLISAVDIGRSAGAVELVEGADEIRKLLTAQKKASLEMLFGYLHGAGVKTSLIAVQPRRSRPSAGGWTST